MVWLTTWHCQVCNEHGSGDAPKGHERCGTVYIQIQNRALEWVCHLCQQKGVGPTPSVHMSVCVTAAARSAMNENAELKTPGEPQAGTDLRHDQTQERNEV